MKYSFALLDGDFRLNFSLNCGSHSNTATIVVYKADTLEEQLNEACREYLKDAVTVSVENSSVSYL